jgi:hypothetical protein
MPNQKKQFCLSGEKPCRPDSIAEFIYCAAWHADVDSDLEVDTLPVIAKKSGIGERRLKELARGWKKATPEEVSHVIRATGRYEQGALVVLRDMGLDDEVFVVRRVDGIGSESPDRELHEAHASVGAATTEFLRAQTAGFRDAELNHRACAAMRQAQKEAEDVVRTITRLGARRTAFPKASGQ